MGKPDALSCRSDHGTGANDNSDIVLLTPKLFAVHALEGLQFTGPEQDILRYIWQGIKQPKEEPVARAAQELRKSSTCSLRSAEWSEHDGLLYYCGCIYILDTSNLRRRIVSLCHDTKVAGHPGCFKTLELVSRSYWWLNMSQYIDMYVFHCDLCLCTKIQRRLPTRELQLLPIPEECWDVISVDYLRTPRIGRIRLHHGGRQLGRQMFPLCQNGYHSHHCRSSKPLPLEHLEAPRPPQKVVSDCGPQFVTAFMKELYRLLGIEAATSTAYHPQTDGQMERVNQELEQYLWIFVRERQDDWYTLLPLAEFSYNNHIHLSTQQTPFLLDTG